MCLDGGGWSYFSRKFTARVLAMPTPGIQPNQDFVKSRKKIFTGLFENGSQTTFVTKNGSQGH